VLFVAACQVQALILAPSRELVQQIGQVASALFAGTDWRVQTLIGGANVDGQVKRMRDDKPQILVATPGRLGEIVFHLEKLRLGAVRVVVVDEVDNMMQAPYVGDLEALLQATPLYRARRKLDGPASGDDTGHFRADTGGDGDGRSSSEQADQRDIRMICLASATSNDSAVNTFADTFAGAGHWRTLSVEGDSAIPAGITHGLISCPQERSLGLLKRFLNAKPAVHSALIFVNDPKRVVGVCRELELAGIIAAPLHGDTNKDDRKVYTFHTQAFF
jgi:superfamily II DNA/RNA helicase